MIVKTVSEWDFIDEFRGISGFSYDGSCYCDNLCVEYGDCCSDACDECGYCERDVSLNYKIYQHLKSEGKNFSAKSIELEHEVAVLVNNQRDHGFLFDFEHGMQLLSKLTSELEDNKNDIQKFDIFFRTLTKNQNAQNVHVFFPHIWFEVLEIKIFHRFEVDF